MQAKCPRCGRHYFLSYKQQGAKFDCGSCEQSLLVDEDARTSTLGLFAMGPGWSHLFRPGSTPDAAPGPTTKDGRFLVSRRPQAKEPPPALRPTANEGHAGETDDDETYPRYVHPDPDARPSSYFRDGHRVPGDGPIQRVDSAVPGFHAETLPALDQEEVEIVMIGMASTLGDVISVRAKKDGGRITYSVVDEYDNEEYGYYCGPESSSLPLTFNGITDLLWSIENIDGHLLTRDHSPCFWSVRSQFYDGLEDWLMWKLRTRFDEDE